MPTEEDAMPTAGDAIPTAPAVPPEQPPARQDPPGPPLPPQPLQAPASTNVLAIVSLVASFFVGLAGVVCGIISLIQIKRTRQKGRGLAIAGIVVGAVQLVTVALVSIAIIAAAAISGVASVSRSIDSLPRGSAGLHATLECARLAKDMEDGQVALREATSNFSSDPQSALKALSDFSARLEKSAADVTDPKVAAAAEEAVDKLNDFVEALRPIAADPSSAGPEAQELVIRQIGGIAGSLTSLQAACAPSN